ncbi:MAG: hypothetical protein JNN13_08445 [Planctomycetes bacterium]|nr:hypothetical protein [Planctomycetota bacterium]
MIAPSLPTWRPLLLATLLVAAACRAPEVAELRLATTAPLTAAAFPGASRFAPGFDAVAAASSWQAGDAVLFGLCLSRGDERRHWLLHLRVTEPVALARPGDATPTGEALPEVTWTMRINGVPQQFPSRLCRVLVTVADADGNVLGRTEPLLPWQLLARGLQPACEEVVRRRAASGRLVDDEATLRPLAEAVVCTVALLQVVQEDDVLSPILWQVVQRPSLWSVLRHLGAHVVLRPAFQDLRRQADGGSAFLVPMTLSVNDVDALHFELLARTPARPFALCGGMLGATARHPQDAELEFRMLLLGARTGS